MRSEVVGDFHPSHRGLINDHAQRAEGLESLISMYRYLPQSKASAIYLLFPWLLMIGPSKCGVWGVSITMCRDNFG